MIHLIVGNTGAGKTTYSNKLKVETKGVIFSIDQWNNTLFFPDKRPRDGVDWILERIERIEEMIMALIDQLEFAGTDAILDLGLSKFTHRQKFRDFAASKGYKVQLHFLDVPKEVRLERVMQRNNEKGETFQFEVSQTDFDFMETWFEAPVGDELLDVIITKA